MNWKLYFSDLRTKEEKARKERIGAVCPNPDCKEDLLERVESISHDWSYGLREDGWVECPECGTTFEFRINWDIQLYNIEITNTKIVDIREQGED